ncbi:MAG: hypothetical protein QG580_412, partial [Patescibacteria group bacterium]|nr:hypothetical protein [Patescibacteria group bacterium]
GVGAGDKVMVDEKGGELTVVIMKGSKRDKKVNSKEGNKTFA